MLEQIVAMLHPFMPFVTEEIAAQYRATPLLEQRYPAVDDTALSPLDEQAVANVQAAVNALRGYRAEMKVAAAKVLAATFVADDADADDLYRAYAETLRTLARTEVVFAAANQQEATIVLVPDGRFEVSSAVDRDEEITRLQAQLAKVEAEVRRSEQKLANEKFVARAAAAIVAQERAKLATFVADRDELAQRLALLRE
jgi:valyl-tRNA synthetase